MWAVALSETHLISASLDASIVVRSFRTEDLRRWGANGRSSGSREHRLSSSSGIDDELELDSMHGSEELGESGAEEEEEEEEVGTVEEAGSYGSGSEWEDSEGDA